MELPAARSELPVYAEVIWEVIEGNTEMLPAPTDPVDEPNYVGTKPKKGFEQKKKGVPFEQIQKKPAFEIYHDPPNPTHRKPSPKKLNVTLNKV